MPKKNNNFQHFDYRIDNVNDRVDHTNERIDNSFDESRKSYNNLVRKIDDLSNQISSTNRWAIGTTITVIIAIIIGAIEVGITLIH